MTFPASSLEIFPAFWPSTTNGPAPLQQSGTSSRLIVAMMSVSASSVARSQPQNAKMPDFWPVCIRYRVDGVAATLSNTRRHRRGAVSTRTGGPRSHRDARLWTRRRRRDNRTPHENRAAPGSACSPHSFSDRSRGSAVRRRRQDAVVDVEDLQESFLVQ